MGEFCGRLAGAFCGRLLPEEFCVRWEVFVGFAGDLRGRLAGLFSCRFLMCGLCAVI